MTLGAISYRVREGCDAEIADIFSPRNFGRATSPVMRDATGREIGRILGTALFLQSGVMVRVIQYEGSMDDVARHMAVQAGVQQAERRLAPFLEAPRQTDTAVGFVDYFERSSMRCLAQQVVEDRFLENVVALRDEVRATAAGALAEAVASGHLVVLPRALAGGGVRLLTGAVFLLGTTLVRVLHYRGDLADLARAFAHDDGVSRESALVTQLAGPGPVRSKRDVVARFRATSMPCLSRLSVADLMMRPSAAHAPADGNPAAPHARGR